MFGKLSAIILGVCVAGVATSQVKPPSDIIVPKSTAVQPGEKKGTTHTHYLIYKGPWALPHFHSPASTSMLHGPALAAPGGYYPADIHYAYNYPENLGKGAIAVVLWYDQPNILSDFNTFSSEFGLPTETSSNEFASTNKVLQVVQLGNPPADMDAGVEESLDTQWTHAMAPNAKIYLVEAAGPYIEDLVAAEQVAASLPGVTEVSNSWGAGEFDGEQDYDSYFHASNVLFLASAGDTGGLQSYPAESPNVIGVGGTSLYGPTDEIAWGNDGEGFDGTGGGPSSVETIPSYQASISKIVGSARGCPDISAVADPATGVAVYDSYLPTADAGWLVVGGTSVACPVCAGMLNGRGYVEADSATYLKRIYLPYQIPAYFRDITAGSAGTFSATQGWDFCTGNGSPLALLPNLPFSYPAGTVNASSASPYPLSTQLSQGTVWSMYTQDGIDYVVDSYNQGRILQVAGVSAWFQPIFTGASAGHTVKSATFTLTASTPLGITTGLYLYNWSTGNWDAQTSYHLNPGGSTESFTVPKLSTYFDAHNNLQILIKADRPIPYGYDAYGFQLSIDQLQMNAVPN